MLRGNLSTRPFYNDRLVTLVLLLAAVVTVGLAIFNVTQIVSLSRQRATHKAAEARDRGEAQRVRDAAAGLAKTVDPTRLRYLSGATREANFLIDQRTFSWTAFFGHVEKTLPLDARLIAVSPRVEKGDFQIAMVVVARRRNDIKDFTEKLQGTGAFYDVHTSTQQLNDDNTVTATVIGTYLMAPVIPGQKAPSSRQGSPTRRGTP